MTFRFGGSGRNGLCVDKGRTLTVYTKCEGNPCEEFQHAQAATDMDRKKTRNVV